MNYGNCFTYGTWRRLRNLIGAVIGFVFKKASHKFSDIVMSFAAGVMLAATVVGLIIPSVEHGSVHGEGWALVMTIAGIFCGAIVVNLVDKFIPHKHKLGGEDGEALAIAIHNLPEGIAAGVGFGTDNTAQALTIAGGIALQNIPEGMVIIAPMLAAGVPKGKTLVIAILTGVIEVVGTLIGYFAVSISAAILPFALAFAGGTMLYVVSDEMIPETHAHGNERGATYALLVGFCLMLVFDVLL